GEYIAHGPQHGAQKPTTTGNDADAISRSKSDTRWTSIGAAGAGSGCLHCPQRDVVASLSYGKRFFRPHAGHAMTMPRSSSSAFAMTNFTRLRGSYPCHLSRTSTVTTTFDAQRRADCAFGEPILSARIPTLIAYACAQLYSSSAS